jgi:hypothetical protein
MSSADPTIASSDFYRRVISWGERLSTREIGLAIGIDVG